MSEQTEDPLDGRALAGALKALRPERAAFEQGVRLPIAEGEEREHVTEIEPSPFLRSAAALLPAAILPRAIAPATLATWSPRSLLLLVVWPALTFAMLLLPFWVAFSTLGEQEGRPDERRRAAAWSWWSEHRRGALITLAVVAALFRVEPVGGVLALLLVSTGALVLVLARLQAAGFAARREVGRSCAFFLGVLLLFSPWSFSREMLLVEGAVADACWVLLALGASTCAFLALAAVHRSPWSWLVRCTGLEALLGFGSC